MSTPANPINRASGHRQAGFSLLEIVIALAIMALGVALVSTAFMRSNEGLRFDESVRALALDLKNAQTQAMRSGRDVALVIDVDARTYSLGDAAQQALPPSANLRVTSAGEVIAADGKPAFVFSPDGGSTGGRIEMSIPDRSAALEIDWLTGDVRVLEGGRDASAL
jgi:general secretion pathway protein H